MKGKLVIRSLIRLSEDVLTIAYKMPTTKTVFRSIAINDSNLAPPVTKV